MATSSKRGIPNPTPPPQHPQNPTPTHTHTPLPLVIIELARDILVYAGIEKNAWISM